MADLVKSMLGESVRAVVHADADAAHRIGRTSDAVTSLGYSIRRFLGSESNASSISEPRMAAVRAFVVSMEHVADIAEHQLVDPALRRHREQGAFNADQERVLSEMMANLERCLDLAVAVFLHGDEDAAVELVSQKSIGRKMENEWLATRPEPNGRWGLDLDADLRAVREIRRIYSELSAIAYECLERSGRLRSRVMPE